MIAIAPAMRVRCRTSVDKPLRPLPPISGKQGADNAKQRDDDGYGADEQRASQGRVGRAHFGEAFLHLVLDLGDLAFDPCEAVVDSPLQLVESVVVPAAHPGLRLQRLHDGATVDKTSHEYGAQKVNLLHRFRGFSVAVHDRKIES